MPKTVKQLTATQINASKPKEKIYYLSDGQGLRLSIKPNGTKTWLFNYFKPYIRKRTEKTIGVYPIVSLQDARAKANEYRALLVKDIDPQEYERNKHIEERNAIVNTFAHVADEWLVYRSKIGKERNNYTDKTRIDTERRVKFLKDVIGDVPFAKLTLQHGLVALETLRAEGKLNELKKRYLVLKAIGEYGERFNFWKKNEWRYLSFELPMPDKNKHHAAIHYKDLPHFLKDLRKARVAHTSLLAILWGMLNASRVSETVGAKFEDIREHQFLPDELVWFVTVSKGGKGERDHLVPLSKQARNLLNHIKAHTKREYLFPSVKSGNTHLNEQTPNNVIKTMCGGRYKGVMTNHGLRTLFSSYCNDNRLELGLDKEIIEICLSHLNSDDVRNAYNRAEYLPYRLKTYQAWANYVAECADGLFDELQEEI
ncbi:tyrosine-type recombinase/integrase [[Pasteurella] aerogenes]|nr:integrase arm-type DNA-binding domain-containing protein [[Pasteurella] aerogenes]